MDTNNLQGSSKVKNNLFLRPRKPVIYQGSNSMITCHILSPPSRKRGSWWGRAGQQWTLKILCAREYWAPKMINLYLLSVCKYEKRPFLLKRMKLQTSAWGLSTEVLPQSLKLQWRLSAHAETSDTFSSIVGGWKSKIIWHSPILYILRGAFVFHAEVPKG